MLVLTRKLQETIKIGDQITITVLRVQGRKVRIGIEAPREVRVTRGEIDPTADQSEVLGSELMIDGLAGDEAEIAEPALAAAVKIALADEPEDTSDEGPATLHKIIHRRMRRDQVQLPSERLSSERVPKTRLTLRDLLTAR